MKCTGTFSNAFVYLDPVVQNLTKLLANMTFEFLSYGKYTDIFCIAKLQKLLTFLQQKYQCI